MEHTNSLDYGKAFADITDPDSDKQKGLRERYAYSAILLDLPVAELKRRIRGCTDHKAGTQSSDGSSQLNLFSIDIEDDCRSNQLNEMMGKYVDRLYSMKDILYQRAITKDGPNDISRIVNLAEGIKDSENFFFFARMKRAIDDVYARLK